MKLVDTHTHLYWQDYKPDLDQVIERATNSGIDTVVTIGVDVKTSQIAADFHHPNITVFSSVGIHPHEAHRYAGSPDELIQEDINKLEQIIRTNPHKVRTVGECGLDFFFSGNHDYQPSDLSIDQLKILQVKLLQAQVELAKKHNLPLIIHCRDAWQEIFPYIDSHFGILHCYSGDDTVTKQALTTRFLISFAANITYPKNEYLREAARQIPLDRIVLETDCPFLSPQSSRGKRNEPSAVREIAQLIAELKNLPLDQVANQTTANANSIL